MRPRGGGGRARSAAAFDSGERLPERVDAVMETVGAATWSHSVNACAPAGRIVISGATSGDAPAKAELTKIFFKQLRVVGSTMGSREELERLAAFVAGARIEPDRLGSAVGSGPEGFAAMAQGHVGGKIVFTL
jgi:D-arabinose 1-dehydrogenase-like Zn-dependent alcohol dehydrogenase